jgi:toxin ParE1/3/4
MPAVRILEAAAAEATAAAAWYESQRAGLGADFREDFKATLDTLREGVVPGSPWPVAWASAG